MQNDFKWILGVLFFLFGPALAIIMLYVNFE